MPNHPHVVCLFAISALPIFYRLNDHEENLREKGRMVSVLQVRTKFLEEENSRLQDRIDSVQQQKHGLDKLLKEQKMGKEREVFEFDSTLLKHSE